MKLCPLIFLLPTLIWGRAPFTTIGPMFHLNFGEGKPAFSIALEWAYWSYPTPYQPMSVEGPTYGIPDGMGYGFDAGVEWEIRGRKSKFRFYTEPQVGWEGVRGLALGPVVEIPLESKPMAFGIQGSGWFLWADLRLRYIDDNAFFSPGLFVKFSGDNPN